MRKRIIKIGKLLAISLLFGAAVAPNLNAATINFKTDAFQDNTTNIEFTSADGVVVTVSGWQAEFPTTSTTIPDVWGPFPTTPVGGASVGRAIFGVFTENASVQGGIGLSV